MKRRMSVKGTAGTMSTSSKVSHIRRESSTLSPPNTSRPTSRLSDAAKDAPKAGKASEASSTTARTTTLGKSVRINTTSTTPTSSTGPNKVPTPTTIKPARAIEGSMGQPPPTRPRTSFSTATSPTGGSHTRVSSISSLAGRPGTKSPPTTTAARTRRPASMLGTELLRQAKLATATTAAVASDVDRSTSQPSSSSASVSDEKENTMRPSPRAPVSKSGSLSAASKRRSMVAVPTS